MAKGLTRRQADILQFIIECILKQGYPPTIAEIGDRFSISSTNGVNDHLLALERKGYIERSSKARSIQVTDKAATSLYGMYQEEVGVLPLLVATGAGAEARKVMGMTVFAGMLAATALGVFFVPLLFVVIEKLRGADKPEAA